MGIFSFNHFPEITAAMSAALNMAVQETADAITKDAQAQAPVLTGFLRDSIAWTSTGDMAAQIVVGAYYGIYVELGTRFMAAEPYFYPAVETGQQTLDEKLAAIASAF